MFGWRRRSEGFEWREYVRTTVLVRRADRQRKIDDARLAALNKVKDVRDKGVAAGQAGIETVSSTASNVFQRLFDAILAVLKAIFSAIWSGIAAVASTTWQIVRAIGIEIASRVPGLPRLPRLHMPAVSLPKFELPKRAAGEAGKDARRQKDRSPAGDGEKEPRGRWLPDVPFRLPFKSFRLPIDPQLIGGAAFLGLLVVIVGPMLNGSGDLSSPDTSMATGSISSASESDDADRSRAAVASVSEREISGKAVAVKGDLLRVGGKLIKLASIEAPAAQHRCKRKNGRTWNCSASARLALRQLVRGKVVTCATTGENDRDHLIGQCAIGGHDIGDDLVRRGHVFADEGFFATYGSSEADARERKVGIWQGETVRPETWRAQVWAAAKEASPDGCPIKGFVRPGKAARKTYLLPWSQGYAQRLRESRGDRWFCDEDEARAAGFVLAGQM